MGTFCYQCMLPTVQDGICTRCGEAESVSSYHDENTLKPGTTLERNRFTVGKKIGADGFGVTYIAFDHKLDRRVALKEYMPSFLAVREDGMAVPRTGKKAAFEKAKKQFEKDARSLFELRAHPNIVHIYHIFRENNTVFYSMEMLEGSSLREFVQRNRGLPAGRAFQLLRPVMQALQFVHAAGMIHGNVSPDHIILSEDLSCPGAIIPKLTNFGTKHEDPDGNIQSLPDAWKTGFTPIEQEWDQGSQGAWTDIYACCAVFYYAITAAEPMAAQLRSEQDWDPLQLPRNLGADISLETQDILMEGMRIRYADRIQSMDELIRRLAQSLGQETGLSEGKKNQQGACIPKQPNLRRVCAWVLEILILVLSIFFLKDGGFFQTFGMNKDPLLLSLLLVPDFIFLIDLVLILTAGGTLGQLLFGLRLRDEDGERKPEFLSAFSYSLLYASFGFPVGGICGLIRLFSGKWVSPLERLTGVSVETRKQSITKGKESSIIADPFFLTGQFASPMQTPVSSFAPESMPDPITEPVLPPQESHEELQTVPDPDPKQLTGHQALLLCTKAENEAQELRGMAVTIHPGMIIGKNHQKSDIVVPDPTVSGRHCSFQYEPGKGWMIRDERSTNGTVLNGRKLPSGGSGPLQNGARIGIGKMTFEFKCQK